MKVLCNTSATEPLLLLLHQEKTKEKKQEQTLKNKGERKMTTLIITSLIGIIGGCVMANFSTNSEYLAQ